LAATEAAAYARRSTIPWEAARDPDGNRFDLSLGMRDVVAEQTRRAAKTTQG